MENKIEMAFEKCKAIQELNKVEGFNPVDYVTSSTNDKGEVYINLETKYRQLWFRLKYPNGKITKKLLRLTDTVAAVEAKVYVDKNDPEENYIASGVAQRFYNSKSEFGLYYLESAETIAEGRALGKAGFGIQFCDLDGQKDDVNPDTGVKITNASPITQKQEHKSETIPFIGTPPTAQNNTTQTSIQDSDKETRTTTTENPETLTTTENLEASNQSIVQNNANQNDELDVQQITDMQHEVENNSLSEHTVPDQTNDTGIKYDNTTPVEEILKVMTVEEAENIVVTVGFNIGKTLRQVSLANYRQLRWLFENYNGDNNIMKAGARLLFDRIQQQKNAS